MINREALQKSTIDLVWKIFPMTDYQLHYEFLPEVLTSFGYKIQRDDKPFGIHSWMYAKGTSPFMMVAHTDVIPTITLPKQMFITKLIYPDPSPSDNFSLTGDNGLGADDRAGIIAIILLLTYTNLRPSLFFPSGEEVGLVGTKAFIDANKDKLDQFKHINFMLQFDRKGSTDIVNYHDSNKSLVNIFESTKHFKFAVSFSTTDVKELMDFLKVSALNISSGYYNEHTSGETFKPFQLVENVFQTINILETMDLNVKHLFVPTVYVPDPDYDFVSEHKKVYGYGYAYRSANYSAVSSQPLTEQTFTEGCCDFCQVNLPKSELNNFDKEYSICDNCYFEPSNGLKDNVFALCRKCNTLLPLESLVFTSSVSIFGKTTTEISCAHCGSAEIILKQPLPAYQLSEEDIDMTYVEIDFDNVKE